jgi:hypothetical protein
VHCEVGRDLDLAFLQVSVMDRRGVALRRCLARQIHAEISGLLTPDRGRLDGWSRLSRRVSRWVSESPVRAGMLIRA